MIDVVGIRFKEAGKIYYFDPDQIEFEANDRAIVETARGVECGVVVIPKKQITESEIVSPLKKVIRKATDEDVSQYEENKKKEKEAFEICLEKIKKHDLKMKLIDVEYTFDNNKILFYFTADGRVDFRELVKDLASVFKTRIELRQIGVRDETKMLGGLGMCGRALCCSAHLSEFHPVSIKMAKEQGLSLNPTKISGACGRLMCCLKYEQDAYEDVLKRAPKPQSIVETPEGKGTIISICLLREEAKVLLDKNNETDLDVFKFTEIKVIREGQDRNNDDSVDLEQLKELED